MSNAKAVITNIQRMSVHDGPGIRTTVFFKGCPLDCVWCHNPECKEIKPQILFYPEKCIGCGMCEKGCYSGAKVLCGKEMTTKEIFDEILLDKPYYGTDGGVTFSGGEPMLYNEIIKEIVLLCQKNGIRTAIETSLIFFDEEVLKGLDYIMADFKIWDSEKHKKYTGVPNETIKENFKKLDMLDVPFTVRTPVITGINDTETEICNIRNFIKDFKNLRHYELLPYHPLGVSKQMALGLEKHEFTAPDKKKMEELKRYADL